MPLSASGAQPMPAPTDADWLTEQLRSSRLTVLCGDTGAAMTALLRDGVRPRLQRRAQDRPPVAFAPPPASAGVLPFPDRRRARSHAAEVCVYFDAWGEESPRHALIEGLLDAAGEPARRLAAGETLPVRLGDKLAMLARRLGLRFHVIFDRFDECLTAPPERPDLRALRDEIFAVLNEPQDATQFLIALREDGEPLLPQLRERIHGFDAERTPLPHGEAPGLARTKAVYAQIETWLARHARRDRDDDLASPVTGPGELGAHVLGQPFEPFEHAAPASDAVELPAFAPPPRPRGAPAQAAPTMAFAAPLREPVVTTSPQPGPELSSASLAELERVAAQVAEFVQSLAEPAPEAVEIGRVDTGPAAVAPLPDESPPQDASPVIEAEALSWPAAVGADVDGDPLDVAPIDTDADAEPADELVAPFGDMRSIDDEPAEIVFEGIVFDDEPPLREPRVAGTALTVPAGVAPPAAARPRGPMPSRWSGALGVAAGAALGRR